ncbi:MAG: PA1571 family protein [Granulosicoccus sp.]
MKYCKTAATDILHALPESVTVCATVDESGDEHEITELMIRRACEQMDADQIWPFAENIYADATPVLPARTATVIPFRPRA